MDLGLDSKVFVVTGAGRGIGRAIASTLLDEGARVFAVARSGADLDDLAATAPDRVATCVTDLADLDAAGRVVAAAVDAFGRCDGLVNNAASHVMGPLLDGGVEDWTATLELNVAAPALLCRDLAHHLVEEGRPGAIVNIGSIAGQVGKANASLYSASKAAIAALSAALAAEWAPHGIRVNTVAPGATATSMQGPALTDPDVRAARLASVPAGRHGDPAEVGALVAYVLSDRSAFVTGTTIVIDGGEVSTL